MKKDPASSNTTPRQSRSNVVPLKGEIDLHVSPTVTGALNDVIDKKPERLVVDLSDVSYIDSAGLADVAGTVAGDDTIFVAAREGSGTALADQLQHHLEGESQ